MRFWLAAIALALSSCAANAATIPLLTGPQDPASLQATINALIQQINTNAVLTSGTQGSSNNVLMATNANGSTAIGGTSTANTSLVVQTVSNAVNQLQILGSTTGNPPTISATGTDTNIGIALSPQAAGVVQVTNQASFLPANGIGACPAVSGISGPLGIHTNIQGFLVIQDWLGVRRYIPAC